MFRKRLWSILLVLSLVTILVPILAACGGNEKTVAPTTTQAPTVTATGLPTSSVPVKIGGITAQSGFGALAFSLAKPVIDLVEWQVQQRGGINVGGVLHPLQIIPYDMESTTAGATKAATLAITKDNVSAVVWGGLTGADGYGVAAVSDPAGVPYFHYMGEDGLNTQYKYTVESALGFAEEAQDPAFFVRDVLKPKTVAYFSWDNKADRDMTETARKILEAAGVKTVYEDFYASGTSDFTSSLTKIKSLNPDVVMSCGYQEAHMSIVKQMAGLGGWGQAKYVSITGAGTGIAGQPGGDGNYSEAYWVPGQTDPGPKAFEDAWAAYVKAHPGASVKEPDSNYVPFYMPLWLAIKSIELAGSTDPLAIAKAARSGNLVWQDSPVGSVRVTPDGFNDGHPIIVQVQNGKLVKVYKNTGQAK